MNSRRPIITWLFGLGLGLSVMGALANHDTGWRAWAEGTGYTATAREFSAERIQRLVAHLAVEQDVVPPALALAVARVESNFDAAALSHKGARGVMQIMPATARGEFGVPADALWDPVVNIRLGLEYLADLHDRYGGRWDAALSHYNGGSLPGPDASPHDFTSGYVTRVFAWRDHYAEDPRAVRLVAGLRDTLYPGHVARFGATRGPFGDEAVRVAATLRRGPAMRLVTGPQTSQRTGRQAGYDAIAADIRGLQQRFRTSLRESERLRRPGAWRPVR